MANAARVGGPLDADAIVATALEVTRESGIDALSMRVVADRVGVTPMAIYRHVATKEELVKLVADAVVEQVTPPRPGEDWRTEMTKAMRDYRRTVARYPGVSAVLLRGGLLPHARRLVVAQIALLVDAGFSPAEARRVYAAYHLLVLGRLTVDEARRTRPERGPGHERDAEVDAYVTALQGEAAFDRAVTVLLDGFEAQRSPA